MTIDRCFSSSLRCCVAAALAMLCAGCAELLNVMTPGDEEDPNKPFALECDFGYATSDEACKEMTKDECTLHDLDPATKSCTGLYCTGSKVYTKITDGLLVMVRCGRGSVLKVYSLPLSTVQPPLPTGLAADTTQGEPIGVGVKRTGAA